MDVNYITCNETLDFAEKHVMAIGFFDGVHLGHQQLFKVANKVAKKLNVSSSALTFSPHPHEVLCGEQNRKYLTPLSKKVKRIHSCEIDNVFVMKFDKQFAALSPHSFVERYIVNMGVQHVVVGFDFTFGRRAEGDIHLLKELSKKYGFGLTVIPKKMYGNKKISSTETRKLIQAGHVEAIMDFLGANYKINATIVHSEYQYSLLMLEPYMLPEQGRYAVEVSMHDKLYGAELSISANKQNGLIINDVEENIEEHTEVTITFLNRLNVAQAVFA